MELCRTFQIMTDCFQRQSGNVVVFHGGCDKVEEKGNAKKGQ